jgi:hypothetical protein
MRKSLEERFWSHVDRRGDDECWNWTGSTRGAVVTYGKFHPARKITTSAHIQAYRLVKGDVPQGQMVCHTCDNGLCCNPRHLFLGTNTDNQRDMRAKGRGKNEGWKLTKEVARTILELRYDFGWNLRELGAAYHLSHGYLSSLSSGRRRPDVYEEFMAARQPKAA